MVALVDMHVKFDRENQCMVYQHDGLRNIACEYSAV